MTRIQPRINGVWHSEIAPWTPVTYSFDVRGCKEAAWAFYLPPGVRHPALSGRPLVELMRGPEVIWAGVVADVDWVNGTVTCNGIAYEAARYPALDGSGNASSNWTTVATANMARGWPILGLAANIPNVNFGSGDEGFRDQTALFDPGADEHGQRWYVGADRILNLAADPTTPTWHIRPKVVDLGVADDDYASAVAVRYLDSATSTYKTALREDTAASAKFGYRVFDYDATGFGEITATKANNLGDGVLTKGRARLGFTSSIEVTPTELLTAGGVPADLSMVEGGRQSIRVHGIYDEIQWLDGRTYLDVLIGQSTFTDGDGVIKLDPVGKVAETLAEIAEEQARMLGLVQR